MNFERKKTKLPNFFNNNQLTLKSKDDIFWPPSNYLCPLNGLLDHRPLSRRPSTATQFPLHSQLLSGIAFTEHLLFINCSWVRDAALVPRDGRRDDAPVSTLSMNNNYISADICELLITLPYRDAWRDSVNCRKLPQWIHTVERLQTLGGIMSASHSR